MRPLGATSSRSASSRSSFELRRWPDRNCKSASTAALARIRGGSSPRRPFPSALRRPRLGPTIGLALRRGQLQFGVAKQFRRQVGRAPAPSSGGARNRCTVRPIAAASSPAKESRGRETRKCPPGRRRCFPPACRSGPSFASARASRRLRWWCCAILDPLRFVEHDQVEMPPRPPAAAAPRPRGRGRGLRSWRSAPGRRAIAIARAAGSGRLRSPAPEFRGPKGRIPAASWSPAAWGRPTARFALRRGEAAGESP